jgi:hypothetical protein
MRFLLRALVGLALMFVVARGMMLFGETLLGNFGVAATLGPPRLTG